MNNKVILDKDLDALFIINTLVNNANEILGDKSKEVLKEMRYKNTPQENVLFRTWFNKCVIDLQNKYGKNEFDVDAYEWTSVVRNDIYDTYDIRENISSATFIYMKYVYHNIIAKYTKTSDWSINHLPHLVDVVINNIWNKDSKFYKHDSYNIDKKNYIIKAFFNSFYGVTNNKGYLLYYKGNLQQYIVDSNQDFLYKLKMEEKDNLRYYHTDILVLEGEDFVSEKSKEMLRRFKYSKVIYKDLLHISKCRFDFPD